MTDVPLWQLVLPLSFLIVLTILVVVVVRGGPQRFGPRVPLPRHLTPAQERRIESFLLPGNKRWAAKVYADLTGADDDEAAYAIDHWDER